MTSKDIIRFVPITLMLLLALALASGIFGHKQNDERMVGQRINMAPLAVLANSSLKFSPKIWEGHVAVVNFFASTCNACEDDHAAMMALAKTGKVSIYGIAWRDDPARAAQWLRDHGNPYQVIGLDPYGDTAIPFAMTGIPETYIIGKDGIIRYHYGSAITDDIIANEILPLVEKLNAAPIRPGAPR